MSEARRGSSPWPIGIVVGLGFVGVANAIMITIALSHPSTPAATDHWGESLRWDSELELRERSAALGWSIATLEVTAEGLALELVDDRRAPLAELEGTLVLERSDSASHDRVLPLASLGHGRYLAAGEVPDAGLYRLTLDVRSRGGEHFVTRRQLDLEQLHAERGTP